MTRSAGSSRHGVPFWVALVSGGVVMAAAVRGAFESLSLSSFGSWGKWLIGLDLANDLLVLPLVAVVGVGVAWLPLGRARAPVQAGLFATAVVVLVAAPGLAGTADDTGNPTIQPLDYRTATLTVLAVVWAAAGVWAVLRARRPGPDVAESGPRGG